MSQVEPQEQGAHEAEAPHVGQLPVDPGHVRTLAHYNTMLAEARTDAETEQQ